MLSDLLSWRQRNPEKARKAKNLYYKQNRKQHREYTAKWKRNNLQRARASAQKTRDKYKKRLFGLKNKPCFDCQGWFNPWQMQFDHRPEERKMFDVGSGRGRLLKTFLMEIKKCDLVCANCHAERSYTRMYPNERLKEWNVL